MIRSERTTVPTKTWSAMYQLCSNRLLCRVEPRLSRLSVSGQRIKTESIHRQGHEEPLVVFVRSSWSGCSNESAGEAFGMRRRRGREAPEFPGIGLGARRRIGVALRGLDAEPRKALGETDRAGHAIEHRDARGLFEVAREIGHSGAAEHDRLGPVF